MVDDLALAVLNRRPWRPWRATDDPPFISAGVLRGNQIRAARLTTLLVTADPADARKTRPERWPNRSSVAPCGSGCAPTSSSREIAEDSKPRLKPGRGRGRHPPHARHGRRTGRTDRGGRRRGRDQPLRDDLALFDATW